MAFNKRWSLFLLVITLATTCWSRTLTEMVLESQAQDTETMESNRVLADTQYRGTYDISSKYNPTISQTQENDSLTSLQKQETDGLSSTNLQTQDTANSNSLSAHPQDSHQAPDHHLYKRAVFDSSCKGLYKLKLLSQLSHACSDCQNLFRQQDMSAKCRMGCFGTETFDICVKALLLPEEEYGEMAKLLRGR